MCAPTAHTQNQQLSNKFTVTANALAILAASALTDLYCYAVFFTVISVAVLIQYLIKFVCYHQFIATVTPTKQSINKYQRLWERKTVCSNCKCIG